MRRPPLDAAYYLAEINVGHAYEVVLIGSRYELHGGIRARISAGSIGVDDLKTTDHLEYQDRMVGLKPSDGKAILAVTPEAIRASYESDTSNPAPIQVVYRLIPGVEVAEKRLRWESAPQVERLEIRDGKSVVFKAKRNGYFRILLDTDEEVEVRWSKTNKNSRWSCEATKTKNHDGRCRLLAGGTLTIENSTVYQLGNDADGSLQNIGPKLTRE